MGKPRITLVTSAEMPNLYADEAGLLDALSERGADPQIAVWNDASVDWSQAGLCVVRSVSDYARDREAFLKWAKSIPRILNNPDVLEWNSDKHYMKELAARGLPVIPTTWLEPDRHLSKQQVHSRFPAMGDFVVKPAVSSGVRDIGRYTANDTKQRQAAILQATAQLKQGRSVMVQRYLEEIDIHGEISVVFFNGLLSHTVEKRAMLHPSSVTNPSMHEAVVTAQNADEQAWEWGGDSRGPPFLRAFTHGARRAVPLQPGRSGARRARFLHGHGDLDGRRRPVSVLHPRCAVEFRRCHRDACLLVRCGACPRG